MEDESLNMLNVKQVEYFVRFPLESRVKKLTFTVVEVLEKMCKN